MKTRKGALATAVVLAAGATAALFLYLQGLRADAVASSGPVAPVDTVPVVVATQDIPAGTALDAVLAGGGFATEAIPATEMVESAVTDLEDLRGRRASAAILAGEQVSAARLQGGALPPGGVLGIPKGMVAVSVSLEIPRAGGGVVRQGDHITVYATFTDVTAVPAGAAPGPAAGPQAPTPLGDVTVAVVPDAQVLRVMGPPSAATDISSNVQVTMALKPADAGRVVFAQENGSLWLALVPPEEHGVRQQSTVLAELLRSGSGPR